MKESLFAIAQEAFGEPFLNLRVAPEKILNEQGRSLGLFLQNALHDLAPDSLALHSCHGNCGIRSEMLLHGQAILSKEISRTQYIEDGFVSLFGCHRYLQPACINVEHRIGRIAFNKNLLILAKTGGRAMSMGQKRIDEGSLHVAHPRQLAMVGKLTPTRVALE